MKKYELMAILANSVKEKDVQTQIKKSLLDRIGELGGKITFEDFWGARGFAYKIEGEKWGYYFVAQLEIDGSKLTELRREWNIDPHIVRFLITAVDPHWPAPRLHEEIEREAEALEKEKKIKEAEAKSVPSRKPMTVREAEPAQPASETKPEEEKPKEEKPKKTKSEDKEKTKPVEEKPKKEEKVKKPAPKPALKKDEIDKKLDQILEDSSLDL